MNKKESICAWAIHTLAAMAFSPSTGTVRREAKVRRGGSHASWSRVRETSHPLCACLPARSATAKGYMGSRQRHLDLLALASFVGSYSVGLLTSKSAFGVWERRLVYHIGSRASHEGWLQSGESQLRRVSGCYCDGGRAIPSPREVR